jgi:hypothetical protein
MKHRRPWLPVVYVWASTLLTVTCLSAQSRDGVSPVSLGKYAGPAGGHQGAVQALVYDGKDHLISAGADGFLGLWNIRTNAAEDRFQVSSYAISAMVPRPGKPHIALIEGDGLGLYRISVWDYAQKKNLFILRFRDPISYITYSGGGNFLIASRSARTGVVFIHPETGELLQSPEQLTGSVAFAATGRSERTMISYSPTGTLSYWELDTGKELRHFTVPGQLGTPILFGNNRFFGGTGAKGLVVLDAISGTTLVRDEGFSRARLFPGDPTLAEFICLNNEAGLSVLYRFGINDPGGLEIRERRVLDTAFPAVTTAAAAGNAIVLGTVEGGLWLLNRGGDPRAMTLRGQIPITEVGAGGDVLAFMGGQNRLGFIPLDYRKMRNGDTLRLEDARGYTHISAGAASGHLIFWQAGGGLSPLVMIAPGMPGSGGDPAPLLNVPTRFPIRSATILGEEALFLDSLGNITVISLDAGTPRFSYSSAGSLDAAFLDREHIIIGRSAVSGNSPFLMINIATGETVPISYPASIGARVFRGPSGALYGAAVDNGGQGVVTRILRLNPGNPASSVPLVEYQGEDTGFGIAESGGALASTIGGDGATLYSSRGFIAFERSPGIPVRLIGGDDFFITLDKDGTLCWHENRSGELAALFKVYDKEWILEKSSGERIRGPLD